LKILNSKWVKVLSGALLVTLALGGCTPAQPATNATITTSPAPTTNATITYTPGSVNVSPTAPATTPTTPTGPVFMAGTYIDLTGAGATFPAPLYSKWFDEYNKLTGIKINYQAIGSGGGITQITTGTVNFGASDGIMTDAQLAAAQAAFGPILHIPMTSGSEAIIYNVPGIITGLKLAPDVLADIYLKKITKWNDPRITTLNTGMTLPNVDIAVVHRSDSSGTTNIFTNYLSKVSSDWQTKVGNANSVNWPGDIGGQGNAGVAGQVQQIPGAIGYVELAYALQNKLTYASLKNAAGNYVSPTLASTTAASQGVTLPDDMKIMLTNSTNPDAYPIVGFTWILVYQNQTNKDVGVSIVKMLWWALHDGQKFCEGLNYAPLSAAALAKAETELLSIKYQGQPVITR
jgi:phosphate transport system substrate-binding protein